MSFSGNAWAVVVAAGRGTRFRGEGPKQFSPLAGKPMVLWSVEAFLDHPSVEGLALVLPLEMLEAPPAWLAELSDRGVRPVAGGAERTDSVRLGLAAVPAEAAAVAVHDGARPLITANAIGRVLAAVAPDRGAVAGRRAADSLKEVDESGRVVGAPDRRRIWQAETPQAFPRELIVQVHERAAAEGVHASDSAGLCQLYGIEVRMVELDEPNPKITRPSDLAWAEAWLKARESRRASTDG
ncbi:MAG: 2-C-methyl-D-erythritol 4-phosphate cytidylyltransferase [Gemmatimonadetes bacterium]|uniref:2-C-methyl-D-erythritol 4-phosphate cytidylyltransferase n=1 Tax=Candidatus Kutchimonas denitrificans TaxID=3056748 RepID=A0AAE4Z8F2_9BACT|nr:2-C-methyl-D-erythritol 4-phosphate cytidylyltransferase [Gemmatimonadota bacterium]NIR75184.1 2-C-methyl-D-erythritol 4-phosphate cytidylyltransferase [Candidatus Kutchimonas denitrificans]NIS00122.1 2-C-methyl-D-erythritol 4-phosphate cytidylyltransferase [Gemmatimonadota bacterium]NIT65714.1 2-C-methyl-D-erythritol 4-phosphate cytidylyltransferase [Gemmatimonadota bacterium]NIU52992.1 2-C-methyl-D-erythritol 4-phosphate cytidylyltransferase [Gemmatimonadota bacterium]